HRLARRRAIPPHAQACAQARAESRTTRGRGGPVRALPLPQRTGRRRARPRSRRARALLGSRPGRTLDAAHADVFHLDEFLAAVLRALAPEPGLLDAAEGRDFRGDEAAVDAHHAVIERFRDAPDAADVAAVEI